MDSITNVFQKAVLAHGQWKSRLMQAIQTGKSEFTVENIKYDHQCEFGKWAHSAPLTLRNKPEFQNVLKLHAEFHAEAAKVLALALAGKTDEAEQLMKTGGSYIRKSSALVQALTICKEKNAA